MNIVYMHWVTAFITSRPVCVYSCSQLRELWFNDLFMHTVYLYIVVAVCFQDSTRLACVNAVLAVHCKSIVLEFPI